ncbi:MAG: T9SS type A sorting domain-containing protein, partial [Bacteroidetes bacterium]|nr:T9SS type A sorting domain-containing protein [Bacteroidota bacterium]
PGGNEIHLLFEVQATPSLVVIMPDHLIAYKQIWPPTETNVTDSVAFVGGLIQPCLTTIHEIASSEIITVFPNPVRDFARMRCSIPEGKKVEICICNALGMPVWNMSPDYYSSGNFNIQADLRNVTNGFYFVFIRTDDNVISVKKLTVSH